MIRTLSVYNGRGSTEVFTLGYNLNGIVMNKISGLGPVEADLDFAKRARGGTHFISSYTGNRNIIIDFTLTRFPGKSMEQIRTELYKYFFPGRPVDLTIESDEKTGYISGVVESVQPSIFSKDQDLQVSIMCMDPYFKNIAVGTEIKELINNQIGLVPYKGSVDTGVMIDITFNESIPSHMNGYLEIRETISGEDSNYSAGFMIPEKLVAEASGISGYKFTMGDRIYINTTPGKKEATLTRSGSSMRPSIMDALRNLNNEFVYLTETDWPRLIAFSNSHGFRFNTEFTLTSGGSTPVLNRYANASIVWQTYFEGF